MASILSTSKTKHLLDKNFSEIQSLFNTLNNHIADDFEKALDLINNCQGKIIFCGLGKTGYIANYASALFTSLGIKCQFLHANEALHGDMGVIDRIHDVFVMISFSGNGEEHQFLVNQINIPSILISSNRQSNVGKKANVNIEIPMNKSQEASPLQCVPTHSNVLMVHIINALAMSYCESNQITPTHFSNNHPGGQIGRDMFMTVESIMRPKNQLPVTSLETPLKDALPKITAGHCGSIILLDDTQKLYGIFTDGDLRRALDLPNSLQTPLKQFAKTKFHTCTKQTLAMDALQQMQTHKITALIVQDTQGDWLGLVHIHDVLRSLKCSENL